MTGPGWVASDATISVPLPDGRVMWLMGDTNIDDIRASDTSMPCLFHLRNSILVQDAEDRSKFITIIDSTKTGFNRTPVKLVDNDNTLFWPGHGFVKGDTAYIFYTRYNSQTLTRLGTYIAKILWREITNATAIKSLTQIPNLNDTEFGNAVLIDTASNYVYFYGQKSFWIINDLYVARASMDHILGPWEYFNGTGWSDDVMDAEKIVPQGYVCPSFSIIKQNGKYYLITQDIGFLTCGYGRKIFAYSSDKLTGPFVNKQTIYLISDKYKGSYLVTYNTTAHPEYTENNEILISYNVNNTCPSQCVNAFTDRYNADLYRPKFVRVPFEVLDSGMVFTPEPYFTHSAPIEEPLKVTFDPELSVAPEDMESYAWDFGDGSTGATTDPFNKKVTHTYVLSGSYDVKLTITDTGGNTADTTLTINLVSSAIGKNIEVPEAIYPNPTSGEITVSIADFHQSVQTTILVKNMIGQIVASIPAIGNETRIELNGGNGVYFVHIQKGNSQNVYKVSLVKNP
jgi:PKD repeat protein